MAGPRNSIVIHSFFLNIGPKRQANPFEDIMKAFFAPDPSSSGGPRSIKEDETLD